MANTVHQPAVLAKILEHSVASAGLIVFPAGLALTICGPQLLALLYGSDLAGSGVALACAMVVAGAQATGLGLGNVLSATGRMWLGFGLNLFWGLLFLGLCLALIPGRGTSGFLIALAAAYLALNALAYASFLARNPYLRPGRVFIPLGAYIAAVAAGVGVVPHLEPRLALAAGVWSGPSHGHRPRPFGPKGADPGVTGRGLVFGLASGEARSVVRPAVAAP